MKRILAALLLLACGLSARAEDFKDFVATRPLATAPYGAGDYFPIVPAGQPTAKVPANTIVTLGDAQTLSNKTLTAPVLSGTITGSYTLADTQAIDFPSQGHGNRPLNFSTTLTGATSTDNIWENLFSSTVISAGLTVTGEINVVHPYLENNGSISGLGFAEALEASLLNNGTVSGNLYGFNNVVNNGAGGTVTGGLVGATTGLVNNNATAGSISTFDGYLFTGMGGSGSRPTNYFAFRNKDANANIATAGNVSIGTTAYQTGQNRLLIIGPDALNSTFPFVVKNGNSENLILLDDNGSLTVGRSGGNSGFTSNGSINISSGSVYKANGAIGLTRTCTVNQALTLIFTAGILTGGTCSS